MAPTLSVGDLLTLRAVADPAIAPGGDGVAATVTRIEAGEPPRYASGIHLFDLESGLERVLTRGEGKDAQPAFSPDGSLLAFVSDRGGTKPQLYLLPLAGGEARRVTDLPAGVMQFAWHPSGDWCAVVSRGDGDPDRAGTGRRITLPYYREDGVGFRSERPAQLWRVPLTGEAVPLTRLPTSVSDLHVGPDGSLWFVAAHTPQDEGYYYRDVWRLDEGAEAPVALVEQPNPLIAGKPSVAPGGALVAYLAPSDPGRISSPVGVWVMPTRGGRPRLLTGELDCVPLVGGDARLGRYPHGPVWLDDASLLCIANRRGSSCVARVEVESRSVTDLQAPGRAVTGFVATPQLLAFTAETSDRPGELFVQHDGGDERRLSLLNDAWVERHRPVAISDEAQVASDDGSVELGYWTLAPREPRADRALVLQIHGGPRTTYGHGFSFEMQLLAAQGYTVVFGNPRGGAGFGYAFSESIAGRVGSIDADDVLTIAEHARSRHADPSAPMHVTGGSYGGFMTNWLIGRTDRFASAVTQRSISNWLSFYGTSDVGFSWLHIETGGNPWEHTQALWDKSPMKHVAEVSTPLLIIHSEQDHRCPIEQAEQLFVALKVIGKAPVELLRFPDEGHDLSRSGRPDRRMQRLAAILDWFERHPGGPTSAAGGHGHATAGETGADDGTPSEAPSDTQAADG
jgi:dipeptidyl aminopeptidase/acylaminoacyl peptidase